MEPELSSPPSPNIEPISAPVMIPPQPRSQFTIFLLSFLFFACLALTGFLYWQNTSLKSQLADTPTPTPIASPDPTYGWKTYTNTKYNYSFQYPSDYKIQTGVESLPGNESQRPLSSTVSINLLKNDEVIMQINSVDSTESLNQVKKSIQSTNRDKSIEFMDTTIASKPAFKYVVDNWTYIETANGNMLYDISVHNSESLDQILSTFRFLD